MIQFLFFKVENMNPYIITDKIITIIVNSKQYSINNEHFNFKKIKKLIKKKKFDGIEKLFSIREAIVGKSFGNIIIGNNDKLYYNEVEIHTTLTERIIKMFNEGYDIDPFLLFFDNLMMNPNPTAIEELYDFLEFGQMPITDDGYFLAYKKVDKNYKDIHTGTMDNSIGSYVSMDRSKVDSDRNNTCSTGLHFCSKDYLSFYSSDEKTIILKINPKDVVSIPSDYNDTKGRACEYFVISDYNDDTSKLFDRSVATNIVLNMTTKQKIIVAYIEKFMLDQYGIPLSEMIMSSYRTDYKDDYNVIINHIMNNLLDKKIKRDTAVSYFKFIKDNFGDK